MQPSSADQEGSRKPGDGQAAISENREAIFNAPEDMVLGNPDGDVTVVEFFDYNCGFCKRAMDDMSS
jgi:protein-disulfide isomerase